MRVNFSSRVRSIGAGRQRALDEQPRDDRADVRRLPNDDDDDDDGGGRRFARAAHGPSADPVVRAQGLWRTAVRRVGTLVVGRFAAAAVGQRSAGRVGRRVRDARPTDARRPRGPRARRRPVRVLRPVGRGAPVRSLSEDRGPRRGATRRRGRAVAAAGRRGDEAHVRRMVPLRVAVRPPVRPPSGVAAVAPVNSVRRRVTSVKRVDVKSIEIN